MSSITRHLVQNTDASRQTQFSISGPFLYKNSWLGVGNKVNGETASRNMSLIFRNISIPKGSVINSATIYFKAYSTQDINTMKSRFNGLDEVMPKELSLADYTNRPRTEAAVDWEISSTWTAGVVYQSPDLKTIVQELINRPDWGIGMAVGFIWGNMNSDDNARRDCGNILTATTEPGTPPYIVIDYIANESPDLITMRVSNDGIDVLTETDPKKFSLIADNDNVLIKEFARGTFSIDKGETITITHNFGYLAKFYAYILNGGVNHYMYWDDGRNNTYFTIAGYTDKIEIFSNEDGTKTGSYFIFYDKGN